MTGEGEARPASQATETQDLSRCKQEIAALQELLEHVHRKAEESAKHDYRRDDNIMDLRRELEQTVTDVKTLTAQIKIQDNFASTVCEKVSMQEDAIEHLQYGHRQLARELESAHTTTTTMLRREIATLREELASLRAQHTGHENGAERKSAGVAQGAV